MQLLLLRDNNDSAESPVFEENPLHSVKNIPTLRQDYEEYQAGRTVILTQCQSHEFNDYFKVHFILRPSWGTHVEQPQSYPDNALNK